MIILAKTTGKVTTFEDILTSKGFFAYTNVGTSMLPLLRQRRDIIEICAKKPSVRCKRYDVVLYKLEGKYILHRILKVRSNDYVLCGDHNIWKEYGITDKQILGVMTRVIRDGKSITPDNIWYKIYVHLWCSFYPIRVMILIVKKAIESVGRRCKKLFGNH